MKRSHRIIFFCITVLSLATFLFALLQFVTLRDEAPLFPLNPGPTLRR